MDIERRRRLAEIMAVMADDPAAVFALTTEFHPELAANVRALMREDGRELTRPEVDDLVMDVGLAIAEVAHGWRPDGALPWTWAKARIRAALRLAVFGPMPVDPHTISAPDADADCGEGSPRVAASVEVDPRGALIAVCERHRHGDAVLDILMNDVSERDLGVFLEYLIQQDLGDPSPANTVAEMEGLNPPHVRQIVRRVRQRLEPFTARETA